MHQPVTAAMIGLSVLIPTVGTQRHSSGRSVTSAPDENARPPSPVRIATRCSDAIERGERLLQLDRHRLVDRVQLLGPVDGDDRNRPALLDGDDGHLGAPLLRFPWAVSPRT